MRGVLSVLPDGDAGVYATAQQMRSMARRAAVEPIIRLTTASLVEGVPFDRGNVHADLIRRWIEARTYFLADPTYAEALHDPAWQMRRLLTRGTIGIDCDDVAMLAAAMGLSIGLRARFVLAGFSSPNAPYRHVWTDLAAVQSPRWVTIDPTRGPQGLSRFDVQRMDYLEV